MERTVIIPDEIRGRLNEIGIEKYSSGISKLFSSYYDSSKINQIIRAFDRGSQSTSQNIGRKIKLPVELFNDESHHLDYLFMQLGSDISFFEEIFLTKQIPSLLSRQEHIEIQEFTRENLIEYMALVLAHDHTPSEIVVFIPLKYHHKMYIDWMDVDRLLTINHLTGKFSFRDYPIELIWSNKFNEFNYVIILKPNFGRWICSPDVANRLTLTSTFLQASDSIEFIINTDFSFSITNTNLVKVIKIL